MVQRPDADAMAVSARSQRPLSKRQRAVVVVAVLAAVGVVSFLPRVSGPIHRLVNVSSNGPQPSYVNLVDDAPLREMAGIVPDDRDETYFVQTSSTYALDVYGAGVLYFPPAVPVADALDARWILAYDVEPEIPRTLREVRRYRIRPNATLVRVEPA